MNSLYELIRAFCLKNNKIYDTLTPISKRSGIEKEAALILLMLYFEIENDLLSEKHISSLYEKGLISLDRKLTGKGSILAKSFCLALEKADC